MMEGPRFTGGYPRANLGSREDAEKVSKSLR